MPNLQLSFQDAADIASWILSVPGEWPEPVDVPAVDSAEVKEGLDELVKLYVTKGGITLGGQAGRGPAQRGRRASSKTKLSQDEKLMYLGEKTISRLGCFGCHNIPGFENAKPIGTPLNGWGFKSPTKLDYGHIAEYLEDQPVDDKGRATAPTPTTRRSSPSTPARASSTRSSTGRGATTTRRPTRTSRPGTSGSGCPSSPGPNDPAAIEEVMTFVLGLTGEKIAAKYLPKSYYDADPDGRGAGGQAPESVQLHGLPRPRDAQVHDRRRAPRSPTR